MDIPKDYPNLRTGTYNDKEKASAAGKKSVKVKRERKKVRELLAEVAKLHVEEKVIAKLRASLPGIPEKVTMDLAMAIAMFSKAASGDIQAAKVVTEIMDGMPKQRIELEGSLTVDTMTEEERKARLEKLMKILKDE
jgi:hypothetical protein